MSMDEKVDLDPERKQEILDLEQKLGNNNLFEFLGVSNGAPAEDVPAEAEAVAKAVAWLMKKKDQLLQVIHDLATPKNEAVPAAAKTLMDVLHAHLPPRRPSSAA